MQYILSVFIALCFSKLTIAAEDRMSKETDKCTSIALGRLASADGSTMTTHTVDCFDCDWRINKVPAQDWPEGSMRPIYLLTSVYPRQVRNDRGFTWSEDNLVKGPLNDEWRALKNQTILGYIPQVPHTYALVEGMYGIMNEYQVAIGESTCAARLSASPIGYNGGTALLEASELTQLALERSKTAREAIQTMGDLATEFGYYSAEWDKHNPLGPALLMGEGGEALTVIDPEETWMFHITPDDTGKKAIWVAQRVPPTHITVVANTFVIKEVDPNNKDDFMYSDNLFDVAEKQGWWVRGTPFNFVKVYAPRRFHPNYATRRVWRIFSLVAPSNVLTPDPDGWADEYPFSMEVENPVSVADMMQFQRDHYEGSAFDMTKGLASGPYGDPNRFDLAPNGNMTIQDEMQGEFPRAISLYRTSYSYVAHARAEVNGISARVKGEEVSSFLYAMLWLGQYAPDQSTYTPVYIASTELPSSYTSGSMHMYDPEVAWWCFSVVGNYASHYYIYAMVTVRELQHSLETYLFDHVSAFESIHQSAMDHEAVVKDMTAFTVAQGHYVARKWREFLPLLFTMYRDGDIVTHLNESKVTIKKMFYPEWWLKAVGYFESPGREGDDVIMFAPAPEVLDAGYAFSVTTTLLLAVACIMVGFCCGKAQFDVPKFGKWSEGSRPYTAYTYTPINGEDSGSGSIMLTHRPQGGYQC